MSWWMLWSAPIWKNEMQCEDSEEKNIIFYKKKCVNMIE